MKLFISYRRKDSHSITDRIYDWLEREFGRENVFKDVDAIPLGRDFRQILQDAIARCDVLLVVIGPLWLGENDAEGRRRVDNPEDYVRIEIETALKRDIPVIPLLVDGAPLPRGGDLPPSLQGLVYRHGTPVRHDPDFRSDMGRLIKALREVALGVSRTAHSDVVTSVASTPIRPERVMHPRAREPSDVVTSAAFAPMTTAVRSTQSTILFGMPVRTGRWVFVLAGMLMNVCLGAVYAWSVFRTPVAKLFSTADAPITAKQTLWPFMLFLAFFTVLMPISGRLVQKVHPRTISLVGSLIVAAGWILSSYATGIDSLCVTYGALAGAGVGIVYGIPIAVVTRWFPDLKGLAVGLTVLGFGLSALVTALLAHALIETYGILRTFFILGIGFLVSLVLMSLILRFPPAGWQPEGWQGAAAAASARNYTPAEMLTTSSCLGLWLCFIIGSLGGLLAISISSNVGQEIVKLRPATAAGLVSFFALFNGGGRPLFGWLTDAIGHSKAAALSLFMVVLASGGMLLAGEGSVLLYAACFAAFWMGLGSWLAIAPTAVATYFGPKNYATNYGIVFSAYGIGAILASLSAGFAKDIFGSYTRAFHVSGSLATVGVIIALTLMKKPKTA